MPVSDKLNLCYRLRTALTTNLTFVSDGVLLADLDLSLSTTSKCADGTSIHVDLVEE